MTEDTTTESVAATDQAAKIEAPAKTPAPRAPKLILSFEGKDTPLLKYAFPVKASKFPVKVNGAVVDAACTEGRGKAYTYLLINNTSFYIPGTLPVDADCSVNFPEGYKFDEAQAVRVSTYKPKAKKDAPAANAEAQAGDGAAEAQAGDGSPVDVAAVAAAVGVRADDIAEVANAAKAARRAKK